MAQEATHGEFDDNVFIDHYEAIADTFIDTEGAARSLLAQIPEKTGVFELGLGTGYFAGYIYEESHQVSGIQPRDGMMRRLKQEHPRVNIEAEVYLQDYYFDRSYPVIVSHSSVFLFTKRDARTLAETTSPGLIFQSFIQERNDVFENLDKVMAALAFGGQLFVNIQPNANGVARVNDELSFGMLSCDYDFDRERVEKVFQITYKGIEKVLPPDVSFVLQWGDFRQQIEESGYTAAVSEDNMWVILRNSNVST